MSYENVPRDSLELASLASSSHSRRPSRASSPAGISSSRKGSLENLVRDEDPLADNNPATRPSGRAQRSYSISSVFDFNSTLFPLSRTAEGGYTPLGAPSTLPIDGEAGLGPLNGSLERRKTLTYLNGLALVVGCIIGSGIFSSPGRVTAGVESLGASIIVWAIAGVLAWTGAASYAELGGTIPLNGGAQVYLAKIFGEWAGFLFTWCAVFVLKPGSSAIISIILGEYVVGAFKGGAVNMHTVNPWASKGIAIGALLSIVVINSLSTRLGTRMTNAFMFFKFVALLGVMIIGIVVAATGTSYEGKANKDWKDKGWFSETSHDPSRWAVALYAGLWAFEGWDNTNYVTGEFKNPSRDLPRVIHTSMPLVILLFVMANVSYFFVLPIATIEETNTIGVQFGRKAFGPIGAAILALVVSGSCYGSLNATMFTSGRLIYAAGREGYLPAFVGRLGLRKETPEREHARYQSHGRWYSACLNLLGDDIGFGYTPIYAMIVNGLLTIVYIIIGEFQTLVTFYGVAGYTFYFFTVLGLIVLRIREPNLERPYKTWITTPIIFCCVSLFLLSRAVIAQPIHALIVTAFVVLGVPVYIWRMQVRDGKSFWKALCATGRKCSPFRSKSSERK